MISAIKQRKKSARASSRTISLSIYVNIHAELIKSEAAERSEPGEVASFSQKRNAAR